MNRVIKCLTEFGPFKSITKIKASMKESLPDDENISIFIDRAVFNNKNVVVGVTEKHLLIYFRGFIRHSYTFHLLSGFKDTAIEEFIFTSKIKFILGDNTVMQLTRISKEEAKDLNSHIRKIILKGDARKMVMGIPCPFCSEIVKTTAIRCPHCHKELPERK